MRPTFIRQLRTRKQEPDRKDSAHDPQAVVRQIPALLAQGESEDRQAAQSRHLRLARRGREARARGAVFQAALTLYPHPEALARRTNLEGRARAPRPAPFEARFVRTSPVAADQTGPAPMKLDSLHVRIKPGGLDLFEAFGAVGGQLLGEIV